MKRVFFWYFLIVSIALLVSSCAEEEEEYSTSSTDNTSSSTTLSAPSDLSATGSSGQVTLDWTALSGASSYTVYWDNNTGVSSSGTAITSISTDNYTHSGLDNGTTYYYKVAGVNSSGTGTLSSEVSASTPLPAPDNLTATAGFKQVELDWDNVTDAESYTVYWDNSTGVSSSSNAITSLSDDNFTHTGLTGGVTYYYKVAAVNSSGTGTLSTEANATAGASQMIGGSMQGEELNLTTVVTTFAGTGSGPSPSVNDTGTNATFNIPWGITSDGTNLYVVDYGNHLIRKIVISSGVVTTVAGTGSSGSADGTGTSASFNQPAGITTDGTNLYVADESNNTIRKIVITSGVVTTLAGTAGSSGSTNATGASARFNGPSGITTDSTNLYVTDQSMIRKVVISTGVVTTLAGASGQTDSTDGTGTNARFHTPSGITTDGTNLYVADKSGHTIRKIVITSGVVTTLAGTAGSSGSTNATGTSASFGQPFGITSDGINLYVSEKEGHRIRKIVISTGVVTTVAGKGQTGNTNATGTDAKFRQPWDVTTDGKDLYVADSYNYLIRKID